MLGVGKSSNFGYTNWLMVQNSYYVLSSTCWATDSSFRWPGPVASFCGGPRYMELHHVQKVQNAPFFDVHGTHKWCQKLVGACFATPNPCKTCRKCFWEVLKFCGFFAKLFEDLQFSIFRDFLIFFGKFGFWWSPKHYSSGLDGLKRLSDTQGDLKSDSEERKRLANRWR